MKTKLLLLLMLTLSRMLNGQIHFKDLNECLEFVRQNNPSLKSENLNTTISEERLKSAWSSLLPQVKAFGTFDNNISLPVQLVPAQFLGGPEGEYAEIQFGTQYNSSFGAEAALPLINVASWKNIEAASLSKKAAEYQSKDKELNIIERAITAYYFALLSREAMDLSQELVHASDSLLDAAEVRLNNGLIEPLEYNRVKTLHLESLQQLRESQAALNKNINALKFLSNISEADTLIIEEQISNTIHQGKPAELTATTSSLPRYQMLSYRNLQASEELKRQRARALPEISLIARYSRQSFSNELNMFSANQSWYDIGVVGLRAEWTLFTGLNRQSSIRQASLQSQQAQLELQNYSRQAEQELQELRINHEVASYGLDQYSEHYKLNNENFRIAGEKYKQGVYTIDQYVTIYQDRVRSQNQYLNKLANYFVYESIITTRNSLK